MERCPDGYKQLPAGVKCRCANLWRAPDGSHWCCFESIHGPGCQSPDVGRMRFGPNPDARPPQEPFNIENLEVVTTKEPFFKKTGKPAPRKKGVYIGAPACFALELACKQVRAAFADNAKFGSIFIVGSCLERADWRDVDVRMMLDDEAFRVLFPDAVLTNAAWEHDPRWTLMTVAISQWMRAQTGGLPIDFQFQPMTFANERHKGPRSAAGIEYIKSNDKSQTATQRGDS